MFEIKKKVDSEVVVRLLTQNLVGTAISVDSLAKLDGVEELVSHDLLGRVARDIDGEEAGVRYRQRLVKVRR